MIDGENDLGVFFFGERNYGSNNTVKSDNEEVMVKLL